MPDDRAMSPVLLQQLTLAILDHPAEEGLHWLGHGSDLASFLDAHPVQA
jgi:hypothetical protein